MAGRRQHTIPRLILKGFRSRIVGDEIFVWLYRRGSAGVETNIANVGAGRDFYGKAGPGTLDDQITSLENSYSALLDKLRSKAWTGPLRDAEGLPGLVAHLATRTRFLRQSMQDTLTVLVERLCDRLANPETRADILKGPQARRQLLELLISRGASAEEASAALPLIQPHLPRALEAAVPDLAEYVETFRQFARAKSVGTIRNAHIEALAADPSLSKRAQLYSAFNWHLEATQAPLLLGDTVCVFEAAAEHKFRPVDDSPGEACRVFLPISANRVLIGTPYRARPKFDAGRLNRAVARCSYEFFVSSVELNSDSPLPPSIGKWSGILDPEALQAIADKVGLE